MVVLIAGASGFIGRHLVQALSARGHEVLCAQRHPPAAQTDGAAVRHVPADFARDLDAAVWLTRLQGVDAVINAVGLLRERGVQRFQTLHVDGPIALFQACVQAGVRRVVQISALGADAEASSRYHLSKRQADEALLGLPLNAVVVQPSLVFGAGGASARLFARLAALRWLALPDGGRQLVQPIHIDDLTQAVVALVEQQQPAGCRLPLVGPQPATLAAFIATLRRGMGWGPAWMGSVPAWMTQLAARAGDHIPGMLFDRDALGMLRRGNAADAGPTAALLGRPPRPAADFIPAPQARMWRRTAQLDVWLPLARFSVALVWIVTGIVSLGLYPVTDSYALLARVGAPAWAAPWLLFGAAGLDLLLGVASLALRRRRPLWLAQIALILFYTLVITWRLPEFWLHPYGPILKNLPLLALLGLLYWLEDEAR